MPSCFALLGFRVSDMMLIGGFSLNLFCAWMKMGVSVLLFSCSFVLERRKWSECKVDCA